MGWWRRLREVFLGPSFLAAENRIVDLERRLATAHGTIREMYWDGKEKEAATARIAGLEDVVRQALVKLVCGHAREEAVAVLEGVGVFASGGEIKPPEIGANGKPPRFGLTVVEPRADEASCVFAGVDPMGYCRTHRRQCLTQEQVMERFGYGLPVPSGPPGLRHIETFAADARCWCGKAVEARPGLGGGVYACQLRDDATKPATGTEHGNMGGRA